MKRIIEWQKANHSVRSQVWKKIFTDQIQYDVFIAKNDLEDLRSQWREIKNLNQDLLLVDGEIGHFLLSEFEQIPLRSQEWGCVDSVWKDEKKLWPDCNVRNVLFDLIIQTAPDLDILSAAYVSGSDSSAKMALSVVAQLGYTRIYLISGDPKINEFISYWKQKHFGVDIQSIQPQSLTLQPAHGSLLVNTIPLQSKEDCHDDLLYMNFLTKKSLVVDLDNHVEVHPLVEEASASGFRTLSGMLVHSKSDLQFIDRLSLSCTLEKYSQEWTDILKNQTQV